MLGLDSVVVFSLIPLTVWSRVWIIIMFTVVNHPPGKPTRNTESRAEFLEHFSKREHSDW